MKLLSLDVKKMDTQEDTQEAMQILFYKQTRYYTYYFVTCVYVSAT